MTLHKKMEMLRGELMNQNIELKTKDNRINDLVNSLAKCEYENVKKQEEQLEAFKKEAELKNYELQVTKEVRFLVPIFRFLIRPLCVKQQIPCSYLNFF